MAFLIAAVLALLLSPAVRRVGLAVNLVDQPGSDLKIHATPLPLLGGVAVLTASAVALALLDTLPAWGVLAGASIALVGGLIDDVRPLPVWTRVLMLSAAAVVLVVGSSLADAGIPMAIGLAGVIVATANAVNIMDGQDGLAGGLAAISAIALAVVGALQGDEPTMLIAMALAGGLVGFLPWNVPPARLFLGNSGAYAVGVLLAFLSARLTVVAGPRGLLAAGACLGPFVFELVVSALRRLVRRMPLTQGDRGHSYDLLAERIGRRRSTVAFWGLGAMAGGLGVLVFTLPLAAGVALSALAAAGGVAWAFFLGTPRPAPT
jgi:UDP-GlcNAc:undecaprenyl-phosphate/decaprenyl-phosphate GlcNAc-1-phosphate transferase